MKHLRKNALKSLLKGFKSKHIVDLILELNHMEQILITHLIEHNSLEHDSSLYGHKIKIDLPKKNSSLKILHEHLSKHGKIKTAHAMMRGGNLADALVSGAKILGNGLKNAVKKVPGLIEDAWGMIKKGAQTGLEFYGKHQATIKKIAGVAGQVGMAVAPQLSFLSDDQRKTVMDVSKGMHDYSKEKKDEKKKKTQEGGSWRHYDLPNVHLTL